MSDQLPSWMGTLPTPSNSSPPRPIVPAVLSYMTPREDPLSPPSSLPSSPHLPAWLTGAPPEDTTRRSKEARALMFVQFEAAFPLILENICAGSTLANALREYPIPLDTGAFTTWMYKDAKRKALYLEAKEVRTEAWTSEMIRHATGVDRDGIPIPADIDRSKFVVDTYKWLVSRENRKGYGDTKTIEMSASISITAALAQANERVINATVIDDVDDYELMDSGSYKQLSSPKPVEDDDDD